MILSPRHPEQGPNLRRMEVPEREKQPLWLERYEALKDGPLWDSEHNQFLLSLTPDQRVESNNRFADTQLLHLLYLQQTNPTEAHRLYQGLKASNFFDSRYNQFLRAIDPEQTVVDADRDADAQLLHLLYLQQTNPTEAQQLYQQLKASILWDSGHGQFIWYIRPNQGVVSMYSHADAQLIHLLYLQQTNPIEAKQLYQKLQASEFWDKKCRQFLWSLKLDQTVEDNYRPVDAQLLHILYLQRTDGAEAHQLYQDLKKKLWDSEYEQWCWSLTPNQKVGEHNRYASAQLLGILVEKGFADLAHKTPDLGVTPPLPQALHV